MSALPLPLNPLTGYSFKRKGWTVEEVYKAISAGVFDGQKFELIHGEIIDKMGQSPGHAFASQLFMQWLLQFVSALRLRIQQPLSLVGPDGVNSEPEPDMLVCDVPSNLLNHRHPLPQEVQILIEISSSSLPIDARVKRDLYARSGVVEYWIYDLNTKNLIVHRHPVEGVYTEVFTTKSASPLFAPEQTFTVPA
jgi:Uma2 family endonuclease